MEYLIGIDIGTSGTKTVLFNKDGEVICSDSKDYPLYQPNNGWAEQDPGDWWGATVKTLNTVINKSGIDPKDIKGVGLSGQMHGLVLLDKNNQVIRRSIIWCDQRTDKECTEITQKVGKERLIEITANPALTGFTASKILWVRNNEPENYSLIRKILLPKDYIRFKLTGKFATEVSDASGMQLLDVPKRAWSQEVLDKLGIERDFLGEMYESPEITGEITKEVSEETGLSIGTPVVGGAGDNAAAAIGTGVCVDGKAFVTLGSSGVVFAHTDKLSIDPLGRVHTFCHAVPCSWHVMGVTQAAGLSLKWFKDNFCQSEIESAKLLGSDPYEIICGGASRSPIGSSKLIYLPYLMGERTPHLNPKARGVFFGLSAVHDKKDMIRSIMEGVSFSQRDSYEVLKGIGVNVSLLTACGGGSANPFWRQMIADTLGVSVNTAQSKEGPALGAAVLAGVGAGIYKSVPAACEAVVKVNEAICPNGTESSEYEKYYQIYKALYKSLEGQFEALGNL
ncbi:MAG: xylulokinase [Clostridiales bacterium]|jgi:xylulokinase|nr:xylulokinase [Clostridiales bacterium]